MHALRVDECEQPLLSISSGQVSRFKITMASVQMLAASRRNGPAADPAIQILRTHGRVLNASTTADTGASNAGRGSA